MGYFFLVYLACQIKKKNSCISNHLIVYVILEVENLPMWKNSFQEFIK